MQRAVKQIKCMGGLFQAELKKQIHKKLIILYASVLIIAVIGCVVFLILNYSELDSFADSSNWYKELKNYVHILIDSLANGGAISSQGFHDDLQLIVQYVTCLETHTRPYSTQSASYLVLFSNHIFVIILAFSIIVASRVITDEYSKKTINGLLTIPLSRWKILAVKYAVIFVFALLTSLGMLIISVLIGWICFGWDPFTTPYVALSNGEVIIMPLLLRGLLQVCYNTLAVLFCSSVAVLLGVVTKNGITSCVAGIGIYLLNYVAALFISDAAWLRYTPFTNVDFSGYILGTAAVGTSPEFSALVLLAYMLPIVIAAFVIFQRQDIKV